MAILVTTAIEKSWDDADDVVFLGAWCLRYDRRHILNRIRNSIIPYHWDNRAKLRNDFLYLQRLNKSLLRELSESLNNLHGVNHNVQYWNVLLGYWLNLFSAIIFDRWEMINTVKDLKQITKTYSLDIPWNDIIPNDLSDFERLIADDLWNHAVYVDLMRGWTEIPIQIIGSNMQSREFIRQPSALPRKKIKSYVRYALNKWSSLVRQANDAFIISSYLPPIYEALLHLKLGQLPQFWTSNYTSAAVETDPNMRKWILETNVISNKYEEIIRALIPKYLPKIFIEGYRNLSKIVSDLPWPRHPSFIFTSNNHFSDTVFKAWTAKNVEMGTPLFIGEHGGYGTWAFNGSGTYQLSISDRYISWGWGHKDYPQVRPAVILKTVGKKQKWNPTGFGLLVQVTMPRYSTDIRSMTVAGQMLEYFADQFRFYSLLPKDVQNNILVRLYADQGWHVKQRWQDQFPDVRLDNGTSSINALIKDSRIFIATYNGTTYLESLNLNVPTIIFWNPKHWELADEVISYFNLLKDIGIFHETPESAAAKIVEIWDNVPEWWYQPKIQKARELFCSRFAVTVNKPLEVLKKALAKA